MTIELFTLAKDNGYATERITANAANVTLDLPDFPNSSVGALRDFAQKQLSEADQRGFSLTGPSRIFIATGSGTHAASDKDSLMFGSTGVDGLIGGVGDDDLIGGAGQDTLLGGAGVDDLFGGADDDLLNGGAGGDWLYGGAGNDTYQLTSGELFDVITDSDGNGTITVDGVQLTGGKKAADGYWTSKYTQWGGITEQGANTAVNKGDIVYSVSGNSKTTNAMKRSLSLARKHPLLYKNTFRWCHLSLGCKRKGHEISQCTLAILGFQATQHA